MKARSRAMAGAVALTGLRHRSCHARDREIFWEARGLVLPTSSGRRSRKSIDWILRGEDN